MNLAATSQRTNSVIVTAVVLWTFGFSACQSCQRDTNQGLDAAEDATSDITSDITDLGPEDVGVDSFDTSDTTDTHDTRDAADLPPLDCTCPVEGATCERIDGKAVCMVDGEKCDFDAHGPDCRPDCSDHSDCGQKQYCNVNFRCFPQRECEAFHIRCPPGFWCDSESDICRRPGDKPVDASCQQNWECESGLCNQKWERCERHCFADEDCTDPDKTCAEFDDWKNLLGCFDPQYTGPECEISCPKDRLCEGNECLPHVCHRTEHCPEGDCIISPESTTGGTKSVGQCATEEQLCNGWEFRVTKDDPFCRLPLDCNWPYYSECPEGYECVKDETPFGLREHGVGTSWCSRRVADGEWPPG